MGHSKFAKRNMILVGVGAVLLLALQLIPETRIFLASGTLVYCIGTIIWVLCGGLREKAI